MSESVEKFFCKKFPKNKIADEIWQEYKAQRAQY